MNRWSTVPDAPTYEVSTSGEIRRAVDKRTIKRRRGKYPTVSLDGVTRYVHEVVLTTFTGPRPDGYVARHYPDRDTQNNRLSNLSWTTRAVNRMDQVKHGTDDRGEKHSSAKLSNADVINIRRSSTPAREEARKYGVNPNTIRYIRSGRWRKYG